MKNKKNLGAIALVVLSVLLIGITLFIIDKEKKAIEEQGPIIETVYVGVETEENLENFTRENAVNKLRELLIEVGNVPDIEEPVEEPAEESVEEPAEEGEDVSADEETDTDTEEPIEDAEETKEKEPADTDTITPRLELLNDEETDIEEILTKEAMDMIYMSEEFKGEKFNRQFAASAMLIYHEIVRDSTETAEFTPAIQSYDEIVYLDNKFMTAHIPLDIFVGSGTGIAFEMQYVDGEWKLNPYTAMMSLNLMGILNESTADESTAE